MTTHHAHREAGPFGRAAGLLAAFLLFFAIAFGALAPAEAQVAIPGTGAGAEAEEPAPEATGVAEALRLLAVVLEDPEARAALVEGLRAVEPEAAAPAGAEPGAEPPDGAEPSLPEVIADQSLGVVEDAAREVASVLDDLLSVAELGALAGDYDFARAWTQLRPVLLLVAAVAAAFWLLRLPLRPILARFERGAAAATSRLQRARWGLAGVLAEIARLLVAWAVGHGLAALIGAGGLELEETLFLNAFLVVEAARLLPRIVFRPQHPGLRPFRASDATARHWAAWTGRTIGVLGYGALFLAPLAAMLDAPRTGDWLRLAAVLLAMAMTIVLVLRNRETVRIGLQERLASARIDMIVAWLYPLFHYWHLIAIAYVIALFVVWRAVPGDAVAFMLRATVISIVLILLGSFLIAVISRRITGGVTLDDRTRKAFPLLETRLNRFVPAALQVARVVSAVVVISGILTVWDIVDAPRWLATPAGRTVVWGFVWIGGVLLLAGALYLLVSSWIEYRLNPEVGKAPTPRERTLLALFSNAFVIVLAIITIMTVLTQLGINIAPLLAGAGVVGLAIGFGAQKLVQDIINGAFIQLENTMNEGDVVTAGPITGAVEKLTIRSVSLRDFYGVVHMIPFSSVDTVSNFTKTFSFHVADLGVAYRENIDEVKEAMQDAFDRLMETEHRAEILPPFEQFGIDRFADSAVIVRARIKTLPGKQWGVGRAYNEIVKQVFDLRGIEIPFPHRTIYMGVDKAGAAPPLNLRPLPPPGGEARRDDLTPAPGETPPV